MPFARAHFRKTAAATAVICDQLGGVVGRLDLMKILYASDRAMLQARERTITGDTYFCLPKGPILSATLNLANNTYGGALQSEWNRLFEKHDHSVRAKCGVTADTDCLSDEEESILREKTRELMREKHQFMARFGETKGAALWIEHLHCLWTEWENPGRSRLPLPVGNILRRGLDFSENAASRIEAALGFSQAVLESSALSERPITGNSARG